MSKGHMRDDMRPPMSGGLGISEIMDVLETMGYNVRGLGNDEVISLYELVTGPDDDDRDWSEYASDADIERMNETVDGCELDPDY